MAQKSVVLYGLVLVSMLLIFQDVVYATEPTEDNVSERKTLIPAGRSGLNNGNLFGGFPGGGGFGNGFGSGFGGFRQPGFGPGSGGRFRPGFRGGLGPMYGGGGFGQPWFGGGFGAPGFFGGRI